MKRAPLVVTLIALVLALSARSLFADCSATVLTRTDANDATLYYQYHVVSNGCPYYDQETHIFASWDDGPFTEAAGCVHGQDCLTFEFGQGIQCWTPGTHTIRINAYTSKLSGVGVNCPAYQESCSGQGSFEVSPRRDASGNPGEGYSTSGHLLFDVKTDWTFKNVTQQAICLTFPPSKSAAGNTACVYASPSAQLGSGTNNITVSPFASKQGQMWTYACSTWQRAGMITFDDDENSCQRCVGNPVNLSSGNMDLSDTDPTPGLPLARTYNSNSSGESGFFGAGWTSLFDAWMRQQVETGTDGSTTIVIGTPANTQRVYSRYGSSIAQVWPQTSNPGVLTCSDAAGTCSLRDFGADEETTYRVSDGRLVKRRTISTGRELAISYDASGRPSRVDDSWGNFAWVVAANAATNRIDSITVEGTPIVWNYTYDGSGNLTSAKLGTAPWRSYTYSGNKLTAAYDAAGNLIESHTYDTTGAAQSSIGPAGDIQSITYGYAGRNSNEKVTHVVTASGAINYYYTEYLAGRKRTVQVEGICSTCGIRNGVSGYDAYGRLAREQSARGYFTLRGFDTQNRVTQVSGPFKPADCDPSAATYYCRSNPDTMLDRPLVPTSATTTTTYAYASPNWPDRPTTIATDSVRSPGQQRVETIAYDSASGQVLTRSIQGYTGSPAQPQTRTTTTTLYNGVEGAAFSPGGAFASSWETLAQPSGVVKSVDGPRTDVQDVTKWVYYPIHSSVPATWRGRLAAVRNAAGHVTVFSNYDVFGNAQRVVDPNGVATDTTYDNFGRLLTTTLNAVAGCDTTADPLCATNLVTTRTYAGLLDTETRPNGAVTKYEYDARGRVSTVSRGPSLTSLTERIEYAYDPGSGKKSSETVLAKEGSAWVEKRRDTFAYNTDDELTDVVHADSTSTSTTYDVAGHTAAVRDENHTAANTTYVYDTADRLASVTQKHGAGTINTQYAYDLHGNLTSVTDPNGNVTTYTYDDFGQMLTQQSPVTGTTTYAYDLAGNLLSTTDANTATTTRVYDVLGRVTSAISTRGTSEAVSWTYDSGPFGLGRLAHMSDPSGSADYAYDRRGLLLSEGTVHYTYDADGNRDSITYPSGTKRAYTYDFADRPLSVGSLVTSATYLPYGPMRTLSFGNGTTQTFTYDNRYRVQENILTSASGTIADYTYTNDAVGNITSIHDAIDPTFNRDFGYDDLSRMTIANGGASLWGNGTYTYDAMGNMLTRQFTRPFDYSGRGDALGGNRTQLTTFAYSGSSPKLATVAETGSTRSVAYDAVGNETGYMATRTYSPRNLMTSISGGSDLDVQPHIDYTYDGRGVRVSSSDGTTITRYTYAPELRLLSYGPPATPPREIVWFGDRPVAQVEGTTTRYTVSDHLGTPFLQTDPSATVIWRAEYEPYGDTYLVRTGTPTDQPLRFPGQELATTWEGREERYNIFRWYRAGWGRYTQADPIAPGGLGFMAVSLDGSARLRFFDSTSIDVLAAAQVFESSREIAARVVPNAYSYVADSPANASDPTGLETVVCTLPRLQKDGIPKYRKYGKGKNDYESICEYGGVCETATAQYAAYYRRIERPPCQHCTEFCTVALDSTKLTQPAKVIKCFDKTTWWGWFD